jgi:hypothetical protein
MHGTHGKKNQQIYITATSDIRVGMGTGRAEEKKKKHHKMYNATNVWLYSTT